MQQGFRKRALVRMKINEMEKKRVDEGKEKSNCLGE